MIRPLILLAAALLASCAQDGALRVPSGVEEIAVQRMRFATEAVCLNNTTQAAQDRAARALDFPVRNRENGATVYVNPGTLTFLRLGPAPDQAITTEDGRRVVYRGSGCSVGSPAIGVRAANRIAGEILAPRLVDGSALTAAPVGAGTNERGGIGFFFDDVSLTQPIATTTITNPETGQAETFLHPVILVIHR
ncbi:hypothetical protein [Jannaschia formosa]|uniref:hypothetical protein n=1 Tax=Jannaschia formosa TaxID=2259592 RepID=UPI000E1BE31E|nr:hypothetical protein [Jannaschia formosa]TFL19210.1 hypothetical protein DR046_04585 [Jannaschia formosa]